MLVIRNNYEQRVKENEEYCLKTQRIEVELINLTSEKKELEKTLYDFNSNDNTNTQRLLVQERKFKALQGEYEKMQKAFIEIKGESERFRVELSREKLRKKNSLLRWKISSSASKRNSSSFRRRSKENWKTRIS